MILWEFGDDFDDYLSHARVILMIYLRTLRFGENRSPVTPAAGSRWTTDAKPRGGGPAPCALKSGICAAAQIFGAERCPWHLKVKGGGSWWILMNLGSENPKVRLEVKKNWNCLAGNKVFRSSYLTNAAMLPVWSPALAKLRMEASTMAGPECLGQSCSCDLDYLWYSYMIIFFESLKLSKGYHRHP